MEGEDDDLKLSASTLEALAGFYNDRDAREKRFEDLKAQAEEDHDAQKKWSMDVFAEDWNASQFWYSDETATAIAKELLAGATKDTHIAVVSAPSVFIQLKNLIVDIPVDERPVMKLLEFDERFGVFKSEFVFYDYNSPVKLSEELKGRFDRFAVDPPFLNADCQTKTALTVRWLSKANDSKAPERLVICTGERMQALILQLYKQAEIRTTTYRPIHTKGLSNEFYCYANFDSELWKYE